MKRCIFTPTDMKKRFNLNSWIRESTVQPMGNIVAEGQSQNRLFPASSQRYTVNTSSRTPTQLAVTWLLDSGLWAWVCTLGAALDVLIDEEPCDDREGEAQLRTQRGELTPPTWRIHWDVSKRQTLNRGSTLSTWTNWCLFVLFGWVCDVAPLTYN